MLALALCLQLQAELVERDGEWSFRVQGASSGARAQVFILWEVAGEISEEPLAPRDSIDSDGHLYSLKRKPYSLDYRIRVGREFVDLKGDPEKLKAEIRERGEELAADLVLIRDLFDELRTEFGRRQGARFDAAAWAGWLDPWMDRVQQVEGRNEDRFAVWAVYIEGQGKIRIEGFCKRLPDLATECREVLQGADPELSRTKMTAFLGYFEEAETVLGVELPLDAKVLGPALDRHVAAKDRKTAITSLLEVVDHLPRHRKAYRLALQILEAYLKGDLRTHATLVTEFKSLLK